MQFLYEFFPLLLFFLAFKFYDIYVATVVGIVTTLAQVLITRAFIKKWDRKQVITLSVFLVFGGLTLYFHDPIFVKWKPTIIFWIFAIAILMTPIFTKKTLIERLMANILQDKGEVPVIVWKRLNLIWALFFATLGGINLYIAYHFTNDAWVNFKFYGITAALFFLSIFQAIYLTRFMTEADSKK